MDTTQKTWTKQRNSYRHCSGKVDIKPVFLEGTRQIAGYFIVLFKGDGFIREFDKSIPMPAEMSIKDIKKEAEKYV